MEKIFKPLLLSLMIGSGTAAIAIAVLTSAGWLSFTPPEKIVFIAGAGLFAAVFRGFGSFESQKRLDAS